MANYKYIKELSKYSSDELKLEYDVSPKDWRFKLSDGGEYVGVEFYSEDENDSRLTELEVNSWTDATKDVFNYLYQEPVADDPQSRETQLETLTTAFDTFVGLVEDDAQRNELQLLAKALFYDNRSIMIGHVVNGGSALKDFFTNYEEGWLDMKAADDKPTPREYALNLLN
jgi:hypothetical protein